MANIIHLTHCSDPCLDVYTRLTEAQLRNRRHPEDGQFIAQSATVIGLALDAGYRPISLLMEEKHIAGQGQAILPRCGDIPVYTAPSDLLEELTGFALTRGMLCAMARPTLPTVEEVCAGAHRIAVIENIVDATNLGAIFRSAAALHLDGVLVTPSCCDPFHRRAVRVSMGTIFQIPWAQIGEEAGHWPTRGLNTLHNMGFRSVAMALSPTAVPIDHPPLMAEEKLAIVLGTEGNGLSQRTIDQCHYTACIPMSHGVDSLNVAAASAVAFWQLRRQEK